MDSRDTSVGDRRGRLMLAGDGLLMSAGCFAVLAGTVFGLEELGVANLGKDPVTAFEWIMVVVATVLQLAGSFVGPVVAWRLHSRRFTKGAVIGGILGFPVGGAVVMGLAMVGAGIDAVFRLFTDVQFVGAIVLLATVVTVFLAAIVLLVGDAASDLGGARAHRALDVARLLALAAIVVFGVIIATLMLRGQDAADAGVFVLAASVVGAVVVTSADTLERVLARRAASRPAAES